MSDREHMDMIETWRRKVSLWIKDFKKLRETQYQINNNIYKNVFLFKLVFLSSKRKKVLYFQSDNFD